MSDIENSNNDVQKAIIDKCLAETYKHIKKVNTYMLGFIGDLLDRAKNHDNTKLEEPELTPFALATDKLGNTKYGTPEYQKLLDDLKSTLEHHYARNRHHPEHHKDGINDMDLVDLLEMLCDWKAATERMQDGNIRKSIDHNSKRYNMDAQLTRIFHNTVDRYL